MLNTLLKSLIGRALPQPSADNTEDPIGHRLSRYRELQVLSVIPTKHVLADEGSYYVSTNPTPGTALLYNVQATFSDTTPAIVIVNNASPADPTAPRIFLDYIKLIVSVVAASGTQAFYAVKVDPVNRQLTTDNTTKITPVNANTDYSNSSMALVNGQNSATASVIAAASKLARVVARGSFGGVGVIGDELVMAFGATDPAAYSGLTAAQAVAPGRKVSVSPPLVIGPGQTATVHLWFPANAITGLSYELEMGQWER